MPASVFDKLYRSILMTKYFVKGWGSPSDLKRILEFRKIIADREKCIKLVQSNPSMIITKDYTSHGIHTLEGFFESPFSVLMPDLLPIEAKNANFQILLPNKWNSNHYKPVCLHMAGTGDHYFWRRRHLLAKPLLTKAGIASIILENPYYGSRKPHDQVRSVLHNVSDIFVMGGCLILEALTIFNWCKQQGLGPLGVTGFSMGGHMASLAASCWPHPIVLVPCLSWSTASSVFTEGVMSYAIDWRMLGDQYKEFTEIEKMVHIQENETLNVESPIISNDKKMVVEFDKNSLSAGPVIGTRSIVSSRLFSAIFDYVIHDLTKIKFLKFNEKYLDNILISKTGRVEKDWRKPEAVRFMRGVMDECTHLANFPKPIDTSLIIIICAKNDGYVPRDSVTNLADIWPGSEVRILNAGHVSSFVFHQEAFRLAIEDSFKRYRDKYLN